MKKLEDIPKENFFRVPEGYFKYLSGKIHERTIGAAHSSDRAGAGSGSRLWLAIPVMILAVAGIFWFSQDSPQADAEMLLASVDSETLMEYLSGHDLAEYELEEFDVVNVNLDSLESEVYELYADETGLEYLDNIIEPDSL